MADWAIPVVLVERVALVVWAARSQAMAAMVVTVVLVVPVATVVPGSRVRPFR